MKRPVNFTLIVTDYGKDITDVCCYIDGAIAEAFRSTGFIEFEKMNSSETVWIRKDTIALYCTQ
jgi:hypothetical protein